MARRQADLHDLAKRAEQIPALSEALYELVAPLVEQAETMAREYARFHWGDAVPGARVASAPMLAPGEVVYALGDLTEIAYDTTKGGKLFRWVHAFGGELPTLASTERGRLVVVGGSYRITARGIVG
ncbi:MAG: hypothetical protein Q8Q14_05305 [Gemmatimonadales bacterium]|nr:hypothetical protein [Gemmatimonadales bacterium]